ncbi:MAG TPA: hypothetical protein VEC06_07025 [Paucimonas sp.]|nr:hypothetical protein [Paucimonas sp.]
MPAANMDRQEPSRKPDALTPRVLTIRRRGERLILTTPIGRHGWIGLLCLALPLLFWTLQALGSRKKSSMSGNIETPWIAFAVDRLLPDPTSAPLVMNLAALGFALLGLALLGHGMKAVIDRDGVAAIHTFMFLPYWRARLPRRDIRAFVLAENGSMPYRGDSVTLYCVKAESTAPPHCRFCGFPVHADLPDESVWHEWLAFSLPGMDAGEYVLELVQAACPPA